MIYQEIRVAQDSIILYFLSVAQIFLEIFTRKLDFTNSGLQVVSILTFYAFFIIVFGQYPAHFPQKIEITWV